MTRPLIRRICGRKPLSRPGTAAGPFFCAQDHPHFREVSGQSSRHLIGRISGRNVRVDTQTPGNRPGVVSVIDPQTTYTACQLANALQVSPRTIERHRRRGVPVAGELLRLPARRIGKVWRFAGREVLDWLAAQQPRDREGDASPTRTLAAPAQRRRLVDQELRALGLKS